MAVSCWGKKAVRRRHMVNDDILLQESAVVCTNAGHTRWAGDAANSSGQRWEPRGLQSCSCSGILCDGHRYFRVGEVGHTMGTLSPAMIGGNYRQEQPSLISFQLDLAEPSLAQTCGTSEHTSSQLTLMGAEMASLLNYFAQNHEIVFFSLSLSL